MVALHKVNNLNKLELCFMVRRKVFIEEQQINEGLEIDSYDVFPNENVIHFILKDEDIIIGCCRILVNDNYYKIGRVAILKEHRSKGYALNMLQLLENELGSGIYKLEAQVYVKNLYTKAGYNEYGDVFMDAGIEHIAMEKNV